MSAALATSETSPLASGSYPSAVLAIPPDDIAPAVATAPPGLSYDERLAWEARALTRVLVATARALRPLTDSTGGIAT